MDFLTLCQETARDSGTIAGLPSFVTVENQTGRIRQLIGWVRDAWIDIQNERNDWLWMAARFQHALTIGQAEYTAADLGITRLGAWATDRNNFNVMTLYDPDRGKADEGEIVQLSYDDWMRRYDRGSHDPNRPTEWAISPQRTLLFGNTPDKAYVLRGSYRKSPQVLEEDTDVPEMPDQFHRLIIAEAIRLMANSDEAWPASQAKGLDYIRLRNPLVINQTPDIDVFGSGPLA